MPKVVIKKNKCKGCLLCVAACPQGLLVVDKELNILGVKPVRFAEDPKEAKGQCKGCALCAIVCPDCCIEIYK
jgi:2-oxoglutarate ferredoxin oxidoreductase subunit delta